MLRHKCFFIELKKVVPIWVLNGERDWVSGGYKESISQNLSVVLDFGDASEHKL